ncbi:hypothetical protein Tco_0649092, partial [Tanacetum coccineum]
GVIVVLKAGVLTDKAMRNGSLKKNTKKRGNSEEPSRDGNVRDDNKRSRTVITLKSMYFAQPKFKEKQEKERRTCGDYLKYEESRIKIKCGSISKKKKSNYSSFQDLRSSCNEDMVKYEGPRQSTNSSKSLKTKKPTKKIPTQRTSQLASAEARCARLGKS